MFFLEDFSYPNELKKKLRFYNPEICVISFFTSKRQGLFVR